MTFLQIISAIIELGAGLALLSYPSVAVSFLVGAPLEGPAALDDGARLRGSVADIECRLLAGAATHRAALRED